MCTVKSSRQRIKYLTLALLFATTTTTCRLLNKIVEYAQYATAHLRPALNNSLRYSPGNARLFDLPCLPYNNIHSYLLIHEYVSNITTIHFITTIE